MKLIVLHGFSQNGAALAEHLEPLTAQLPRHMRCVLPDAPHACSEASVTRLRAMLGRMLSPPHLCWWNATDDGRLYRGWEVSLARLQASVAGDEPFALMGFSQGAIAAAVLSALAQRGEFPAPRFSVLVAGRIPRAESLKPMFEGVLSVDSLHVWGDRDVMAREQAPKLVESFDPSRREVVRWDGPHVLPTFGAGADAILSFIRKHTCI